MKYTEQEIKENIANLHNGKSNIEHVNIISKKKVYESEDRYIFEVTSESGVSYEAYTTYDCLGVESRLCSKETLQDCINHIKVFEFLQDVIYDSLENNTIEHDEYIGYDCISKYDEIRFESNGGNYDFIKKYV